MKGEACRGGRKSAGSRAISGRRADGWSRNGRKSARDHQGDPPGSSGVHEPADRVWFSLLDKTHSPANLQSAFDKVWGNGGSAGADGQTVAHFERHAETELQRLHEQLRDGTYRPQPVRRAWIPKPGSNEKRPLGIPAVRDRRPARLRRWTGRCGDGCGVCWKSGAGARGRGWARRITAGRMNGLPVVGCCPWQRNTNGRGQS